MITNEKINLSANTYLKGIIDYVKWTSTIAIAIIILIGSNLTTIKGSKIIIFISLSVLALSLIIAIFTVGRVLDAWALNWECDKASLIILKSIKIEGTTVIAENIDSNQINRLNEAIEANQPYNEPKVFNSYVTWHVSLLVIGLYLYLAAQALNTFWT